MTRRHTRSKRDRSHGAYRRRLQLRGLSSAPRMTSLRSLRRADGVSTSDLPKDVE